MACYLLDVGNSYFKLATLEQEAVGKVKFYPTTEFVTRLSEGDELYYATVKSATRVEEVIEYCANNNIKTTEITTEPRAFGVTHGYANYQNHGVDRWLALVAAYQLSNGKGAAVIDLGTANTLDVVDGNGQHIGGWIAPGYELQHQSVLQHTDKVFTDEQQETPIFALDTPGSLASGCLYQTQGFVLEAITQVENYFDSELVNIYLTGGNANNLRLENEKDLIFRENLVLEGLALYAKQAAKKN